MGGLRVCGGHGGVVIVGAQVTLGVTQGLWEGSARGAQVAVVTWGGVFRGCDSVGTRGVVLRWGGVGGDVTVWGHGWQWGRGGAQNVGGFWGGAVAVWERRC